MTKQNVLLLLTSYPQKHRGVMQPASTYKSFSVSYHATPSLPHHHHSSSSSSSSSLPSPSPLSPRSDSPPPNSSSPLAFQTGTMLIKVARSVNLRGRARISLISIRSTEAVYQSHLNSNNKKLLEHSHRCTATISSPTIYTNPICAFMET